MGVTKVTIVDSPEKMQCTRGLFNHHSTDKRKGALF